MLTINRRKESPMNKLAVQHHSGLPRPRLRGLADGEDNEPFVAARRTAGRTDAAILAELPAPIAGTLQPA